MGLRGRLEALEAQTPPKRSNPEARARMKKGLSEIADARRNGRPLSPEALPGGGRGLRVLQEEVEAWGLGVG